MAWTYLKSSFLKLRLPWLREKKRLSCLVYSLRPFTQVAHLSRPKRSSPLGPQCGPRTPAEPSALCRCDGGGEEEEDEEELTTQEGICWPICRRRGDQLLVVTIYSWAWHQCFEKSRVDGRGFGVWVPGWLLNCALVNSRTVFRFWFCIETFQKKQRLSPSPELKSV